MCCVAAALGCSSEGGGGKGRDWTGDREMEDRISRTGDDTKLVEAWEFEAAGSKVPFSWDMGTVPEGMTANMYGLMKADEGSALLTVWLQMCSYLVLQVVPASRRGYPS